KTVENNIVVFEDKQKAILIMEHVLRTRHIDAHSPVGGITDESLQQCSNTVLRFLDLVNTHSSFREEFKLLESCVF
ncbi:hypothetical protein HDU99_002403, partial [Rhizoclosmatium hyalinum]